MPKKTNVAGTKNKGSPKTDNSQKKIKEQSTSERWQNYYYISFSVVFTGILLCYTGYAYLQESLLADKSKKMNASLVISIQGLVGMFLSYFIIKLGGMGSITQTFQKTDALVAILTFSSMFCSNQALKYVSFPIQALAKSAKVLPVIICGILMGSLNLRKDQVPIALMITAGLVIFNSKKLKGMQGESVIGYALVLSSLIFDGLTSSTQDKNHKESKRVFAYFTMFYNNTTHFALNLIIFLFYVFYYGDDSVERLLASPELMRETIIISLLGAFGQIFIFLGISLFDAFKVSIVTTARKCFSVVASAYYFNHNFSQAQWIGAAIVLFSTCAEVYFGAKSKKKKD